MYTASNLLSKPALGCPIPISCNRVSWKTPKSSRCGTSKLQNRLGFGSFLGSTRFISPSTVLKHGRALRNSAILAILNDDDTGMTSREGDAENIGLFETDPGLRRHEDHFRSTIMKYSEQKRHIESIEGSLEEFSLGFLKFGFNKEEGCIVYREWAPAAQEAELIIGDSSGWNGSNHKMEKDKYGVWSVSIPDSYGKPAIPHRSRVKFRFKHGDGAWVDRIPAWIKYVSVDPASLFDPPYDGVYWDPPPSERYQFKYRRPPKPISPRIYEAHVQISSSSEPHVNSYRGFADHVLPRIKANNYNTVQLMAIMEHSRFESLEGYNVTNFFAASSRSGTPEDLKYLIDKAHRLGLQVLMDVIHSHASANETNGLSGFHVGQSSQDSYFRTGEHGYHSQWQSRLFNYANWEVLRFLLSNLRWWMEEFKFDGFRFHGVTSMLYHHHGNNMEFTGNYEEYFNKDTDVDAVVYMMLANRLIHKILPDATIIAEDVSGMPGLCRPVPEGGIGFDYRLATEIPLKWIDYLTNRRDEDWSMHGIIWTLTDRRYTEKSIAYAESHSQAIVGGETIAALLKISAGTEDSPVVKRGIALHKMIHLITMALGGDGYLNFMGNEFGHSSTDKDDSITFGGDEGNDKNDVINFGGEERDNKDDSINFFDIGYAKCRIKWHIIDTDNRYKFLNDFDRAVNLLDEKFSFLASPKLVVSRMDEEKKVIVFERGDLIFVFNFHPSNTYTRFKAGCELPGKYRVVLNSDALQFGGLGRVKPYDDYFTSPGTNYNSRPNFFRVVSPPRTCVVYYRVDDTYSNYGEE